MFSFYLPGLGSELKPKVTRYERPKKLILVGKNYGPIFSVCGPKYRRLSV